MKYAMLIYHDEAASAAMTAEEQQANMNAYWAFTQETQEGGVSTGMGEALHPTSAATSVRVRDGQTLSSDGPFAETKEQLGGFYILDCESLEQAIAYAAKIPDAKNGTIEIRPLVIFE